MCTKSSQQGFTLIELVITLVVLAAGLAGILLVYTNTILRSADPVLQQQAVAVAEGYMEEIQAKRCNPGNTSGGQRGHWQYVDDYDQLQESPRQIDGTALAELADYQVRIEVTESAFGPAGQQVNGCWVHIRVNHQRIASVEAEFSAFMAPWIEEGP
ncbi:MSHA pilin protein MshD [Nitrincola lacisaponensis]|uniref:MSHA pilin protein MshD n=1 Tax=Nitrincola lacisaponensis TaxID=267850 RepID=A0A063Y188_9GAMM|nr:type II secretion system protein [Nitrincola lacisaponensis]KDE40078.1 MSHA pilin protein MshD [Nitrincola lacisaponensis]